MKLLLKNLKQPILVALIIGLFFIMYILSLGVRKTQAGAYLQQAKIQQGLNADNRAEEYYKKAIESFPESYILKEYQLFQSTR